METRIKVTDQEKLTLLYERFRDVCLVEKEVWKEIFMPREVTQGPVRTNIQDRYDVEIDDPEIEDALDANIPRGSQSHLASGSPDPGVSHTYFILSENLRASAGREHPLDILHDLWRQRLCAVMVPGDDLA
jgi:hypothetical protein